MKQKIVIFGGKESGIGAAILAQKKGFDVWLTEQGNIKDHYKKQLIEHGILFEEGGHCWENIQDAHCIVKSPGIPSTIPMLQTAIDHKIKIISELEFAYLHKGVSKIIAITGTNGKSTTTALIYYICQQAGLNCSLVGNIGHSICLQIAQEPTEYYITEVSSFQLDDIEHFKADIAILLNITPDHLDRYQNIFENYVAAKFKIIKNQSEKDYFIYNADDEVITKYLNKSFLKQYQIPFSMKKQFNPGGFINLKNQMMSSVIKEENFDMSTTEFSLSGIHNQQNIMAATSAAQIMGIKKENIRKALSTFNGLEHRLEFVAKINDITFINDSKSTNINCTWYALESIKQPIVLILGGRDKGNDYSVLNDLVKRKVKAIICLGECKDKIVSHFSPILKNIIVCDNLLDTVKEAYHLSFKNDCILFSPACASFDMFDNYEERGKQFKKCVNLIQ